MTPAPKRGWLRFSLRTLFIAVTAFGIWLGWYFSDVRQRMVMREFIAEIKGEVVEPPADENDIWLEKIPKWRKFLGDRPAEFIALPLDATDEQVRTVKRLFPEAQVLRATWNAHGNFRHWKTSSR
jgi:hypothetical protein